MLLRLFLLFTLVPLAELALLIRLGGWLGLWPTLGLVLLTGALGAWLARMQGLSVLRRMQEDMARGVPPAERLFEGVCILAAGILLLTPGFLTDAAGLALLVPPLRRALLAALRRKMNVSAASSTVWARGGEEEDDAPFPR